MMPQAGTTLLIIAAVFAVLALRGYLKERRLLPQHRIWLTVATIFAVVSMALRIL